jgi:hypothetical protein
MVQAWFRSDRRVRVRSVYRKDCFVVKIRYPNGRGAPDHLRDTLRRRGRDSMDDFAAGIREQWGYGYLRSYRLALELGREQS